MRCPLSVILFSISLVSLGSRRISPNGFGGNFPLSLILFSQRFGLLRNLQLNMAIGLALRLGFAVFTMIYYAFKNTLVVP